MIANKPITFAEKKKIEELCLTDLSLTMIAKKIGRSKNGVIEEVRKNGGREVYTAQKSKERAMQMENNKKALLKHFNEGRETPYVTMSTKIAVIEMQLEIIIEQLNKLTKG